MSINEVEGFRAVGVALDVEVEVGGVGDRRMELEGVGSSSFRSLALLLGE